ncbi:hypothetical protein [Curtobacterium sp. VKM Ac-2852]|uniref:hypothetical protein n=1 Tax=Curtobacterium sp. VKM Ac-2852 TaxID=2739024 RepID=UPI001564F48A|nr:hypothetical protein [Curtobacterium sp. VKM Ac-2852]NQX23649.1 hypothetical protein [Curtobacterium sp. VKM Ac-2852]
MDVVGSIPAGPTEKTRVQRVANDPSVAEVSSPYGFEVAAASLIVDVLAVPASARFPERQPPDPEGSNRSSPRVLGDHPGVR